MKVYNTFDNKPQHTLKPIEKIVWHTIKGILCEYYRNTPETSYIDGKHPLEVITITVKPTDGSKGKLTTYIVTPSPKGLLLDVRETFKSFIPIMQTVQGCWNETTKETAIIIQTFDIRLRHYSGLQLEG